MGSAISGRRVAYRPEVSIFHLNSIAGTCKLLAEYARSVGVRSDYLTTEYSNRWGHNPANKVRSKWRFFFEAPLHATNYNSIVLHGNFRQVGLYHALFDNVFLYHHGSDIRGKYKENKPRFELARHIFVSTPDLLDHVGEYPATYIPNPVDPMFIRQYDKGLSPSSARAFTFAYKADEEARALAKNHGLELDVLPRDFQHDDLRDVMRQYTHYIDIKRDLDGRSLIDLKKGVLSMTALEALGMGLTVLTVDGEAKGLPDKHRLENAGKLFLDAVREYTLW